MSATILSRNEYTTGTQNHLFCASEFDSAHRGESSQQFPWCMGLGIVKCSKARPLQMWHKFVSFHTVYDFNVDTLHDFLRLPLTFFQSSKVTTENIIFSYKVRTQHAVINVLSLPHMLQNGWHGNRGRRKDQIKRRWSNCRRDWASRGADEEETKAEEEKQDRCCWHSQTI